MATRLIRYDFSTYAGPWPVDPSLTIPDTATTPSGYFPFRCASVAKPASDSFNWWNFLRANWVVPGTIARPAPAGTSYYLHHQMCTVAGQVDTYLCDSPPGIGIESANLATCAQVGPSFSAYGYPSNITSPVDLATELAALDTDYLFGRFKFRLTDTWQTQGTTLGGTFLGHPWLKFIRLGANTIHDNYGPNIHLSHGSTIVASGPQYSAGNYWRMCVFKHGPSDGSSWVNYYPNVNFLDAGEGDGWHSICFLWHTLVHGPATYGSTPPNGELSFWVDDWNCTSAPACDKQACYFPGLSASNYRMTRIYLANNWNGYYPATLMGIDFGGPFEVWGGEPTTAELIGVTPLLNDGQRRYWRIRYRDSGGAESSWSMSGDYFDTAITATGAITLGGVDVEGGTYREIECSGAIQLGWMRVVGRAVNPIYCNGAITLGEVEVSGLAERSVTAQGAITLGALTLTNGSGARVVTAQGAITLPKAGIGGDGLLNNAAPLSLPGVKYYWRVRFSDSKGRVSPKTTTGDYFITAAIRGSFALPHITLSGQAARVVTSSGAISLAKVGLAGGVGRTSNADGAITLGKAVVAGQGARVVTSSGAVQLRRMRVLDGVATRVITAQGALTLGKVALASETTKGTTASGAITLGRLVLAGRTVKYATGAIVLGSIELDGVCAGREAYFPVTTVIRRRYVVTTRIERRCTVTTTFIGEREA